MMNQEHISVADLAPPDTFESAFAENLALVLEMLDCMRSEAELAERHDEADFLGCAGRALAMFARVRCGTLDSMSRRNGLAALTPRIG